LLLRGADRLASATGLLDRPFDAARMMRAAQNASGLSDFGPDDVGTALDVLLKAYRDEARLSVVGRMAIRWDVNRFLSNLLRLRAEEAANPAILARPITRPIIITGLPRSGTTFLHTLLVEDPANRVPRYWQTVYPYPLKPGDQQERVDKVAHQLTLFSRLAPDFQDVHPIGADSPQECSEITAHIFRSLRFDTTHRIPSYLKWVESEGHMAAYRFHRRFLQHLQAQLPDDPQARFVVKCPDHIFALDAIRTIYPDARYVFVHRDPVKVLASVTKLTEILRAPFTRNINRAEIGRQESVRWAEGAQRLVRASAPGHIPAERVWHVHHTQLIADPLGSIAELYRHFDMELTEPAAQAMRRRAATRAGGVRHMVYRLQDYGLDPAQLRQTFADYVAHFSIATESGEVNPTNVAA
jgi:hypothetical protein